MANIAIDIVIFLSIYIIIKSFMWLYPIADILEEKENRLLTLYYNKTIGKNIYELCFVLFPYINI